MVVEVSTSVMLKVFLMFSRMTLFLILCAGMHLDSDLVMLSLKEIGKLKAASKRRGKILGVQAISHERLLLLFAFCKRCVDVTGAYSALKTELNISLTATGLLWTTTGFIAKRITHGPVEERETRKGNRYMTSAQQMDSQQRQVHKG
ncbi:uncharacterized protein LOC133816598 isoform X1 [Humulus lupulus]|uniref:uncharacterized protein LOC133801148 isoform X1 n=2 Tax=Humulus lupulus TaxID=3486 RepID=UPI002B40D6C1|nr:uncharacterized protein LOC133801148 isoform X1 [Humulus lupulus]XP_062104946.1 uncharacterized protein LOC133816510 isoform X1 [Humulus lupulus]XP_062104984.1 uncharacterized protein LOC133816598 isoform X1 [Humulus lupulus]